MPSLTLAFYIIFTWAPVNLTSAQGCSYTTECCSLHLVSKCSNFTTVVFTVHCAEKIVSAQVLCQQKGWTGGGGWGHPQGAVHMAAARFGSKMTMVGTGWANSA